MGLFDRFQEREEPRAAVPDLDEKARKLYYERKNAYDQRKSIGFYDAAGKQWRLAAEGEQLYLFPQHDIIGTSRHELEAAREIVVPREALRKVAREDKPIRTEGIFDIYETPKLQIAVTIPGREELILTAQGVEQAITYFAEHQLAPVRSAYDMLDYTGPVFPAGCKQGAELFPNQFFDMQVFRDETDLIFIRARRKNYYGGGESTVAIGRLPAKAIRFYRLCGGVRMETRVTGGEVSFDRYAYYRGGHYCGGLFRSEGRAIEDALYAEPVRAEQIEHDERYVEVCVRMNGKTYDMEFTPDSLAAFDAMVPEREFDEAALNDRAPTPAEELAILAALCEKGYVTREEFDRAKERLLEKI